MTCWPERFRCTSVRRPPIARRGIVVALCGLVGTITLAGPPAVNSVAPRGGMRGSEHTLTLNGNRLAGPVEVTWYGEGIETRGCTPVGEDHKKVEAKIFVRPDCRPGEHPFRISNARGFSRIHTFFVGCLPDVQEEEPNNDPEAPQPLEAGATVHGVLKDEDTDYYRLRAAQGQRITAEIEALQLGRKMVDPYIAILDSNGVALATCDDCPLLQQDAYASVIAPYDGDYYVETREAAYRGGGSKYLLHVGDFPRPSAVYPAGGPAGETVSVSFIGDVQGATTRDLALDPEGTPVAVWPAGDVLPPTGNPFRVSPFPNVLESEPNETRKDATVHTNGVPIALNGVIQAPKDVDEFRITAPKGQNLQVQVYAQRIGSPLDPTLFIGKSNGQKIKVNDDSVVNDSAERFTVPDDGVFTIRVRDHLWKGGEDYVYRVEITSVEPRLTVSLETFKDDDPQLRHRVIVPRGNRFALPFLANREDFSGAVAVSAPALPDGVTLHAPDIPGGSDRLPVMFEAATNAPLAVGLYELSATAAVGERIVGGGYRQEEILVLGDPNNAAWHTRTFERLPIAVAEEAPFAVRIEPPSVPLIQGGTMRLKVVADRAEGFKQPVHLGMLYKPKGFGAENEVKLGEGKAETHYRIDANGKARPGRYPLAVVARAKVDGGEMWVASPYTEIEVIDPYLAGEIEMVAVEQGKTVEVVCTLDQRKPFEGEAVARLVGLPAKTSSTNTVKISREDGEAVFLVRAEPDSPKGKHPTLFCSIDVPVPGGTITHSIGAFGTLRIDPPQRKREPPAQQAKAAEKPKEKKPRRLTRLEQLRQQAGGEPAPSKDGGEG